MFMCIHALWRCIKLLILKDQNYNITFYRYRITALSVIVLIFFCIIVANNLIQEQLQIETNTWLFFDLLNIALIYYNIENIYFNVKRDGGSPDHKDTYSMFIKWKKEVYSGNPFKVRKILNKTIK